MPRDRPAAGAGKPRRWARGLAGDFDFTEDVSGLQVPTMLVAADADMAPPSHYAQAFSLLDGGRRDGGWGRAVSGRAGPGPGGGGRRAR